MRDHGIDEFIFSTGAGTGLWHGAEGASLTGDIVLPDDFDLVPLEGFGGEFIIFKAEGEGVATAWSNEEGVNVVDVDFRLNKGTGDGLEEGFVLDLHRDEPALDIGKVVFDEQVLGFFGIVNDEANDGAVGGIENGERHHMHFVHGKQTYYFIQASDLVIGMNGKLDYGPVRVWIL